MCVREDEGRRVRWVAAPFIRPSGERTGRRAASAQGADSDHFHSCDAALISGPGRDQTADDFRGRRDRSLSFLALVVDSQSSAGSSFFCTTTISRTAR